MGSCSICGGRVLQYSSLCIVGPFPPAQCESCGAVEMPGPVIPMRPQMRQSPTYWVGSLKDEARVLGIFHQEPSAPSGIDAAMKRIDDEIKRCSP